IQITGIILKNGNTLPFASKQEFEGLSAGSHLEDICNKLRATISSNIGGTNDTIGCSLSSLTGRPGSNHVIVNLETKGSVESHKFASELFGECEKRRTNLNVMNLNLQQPFGKFILLVQMNFVKFTFCLTSTIFVKQLRCTN
ncbi:unnamed protein product, partial [Dicrocoelium dendriticum]